MFSNFGWIYLSPAISSKSRFSLKRLLIRCIADIVIFYRLSAYSVDSDSPLFVLFGTEEIFYALNIVHDRSCIVQIYEKIDVIQYKIKKQYFNVISLFMKKMKSF